MPLERNSLEQVRFLPCETVNGSIRPPGSKSLTNRALICAAMASGESRLSGVLDSEDTKVMVDAWRQLGLELEWNTEACELRMVGCGGQPSVPRADLFIANSGTTMRFLTAALATCRGEFQMSGVPRMHQRPVRDLIDGLNQLGGNVASLNESDPLCPPVLIRASGLRGGQASIPGNVSSQFLSGLMMAAPYAQQPVELRVHGELVSKPYVTMTASVMASFGVAVESKSENSYWIEAPQSYVGIDYAIEPDASAASYFFATAAITGGRVCVEGLNRDALQGDVAFCDVLEKMGCRVLHSRDSIEVHGGPLSGIDIDMGSISDTVQTLAAVALFARGSTRVRGVAHNRHKETDRIGDLATELRKLGASVEEHDDGLTIHPGHLRGATIETYNDHRMAMSLSLVGLKIPDVWITNPKCTEKTYPRFFEEMDELLSCRSAGHRHF